MQVPSISIDTVAAARRSEGALSECEEKTIRAAELRYRKFLGLAAKYPEEQLAPARDIDEVWHLHMLRPGAYVEDCNRILGAILDHDGGFGKESDEQYQDLVAVFNRTATLWENEYGEPYTNGDNSQVVKCIRACRVACQKKSAMP